VISTYTKDFFSWKKNDPNFPKFWRFFIIKSPDFYAKSQQVGKNIEGFSFFSTFISSMQPNLAKLFCEWLPLWLHHKILKRNRADTKNRLVSPKPGPRTTWYIHMHAFDQQFSKVKKLVLTVWPLGPAIFSKTIRPVWKLACGSKESKKGGSKNLP